MSGGHEPGEAMKDGPHEPDVTGHEIPAELGLWFVDDRGTMWRLDQDPPDLSRLLATVRLGDPVEWMWPMDDRQQALCESLVQLAATRLREMREMREMREARRRVETWGRHPAAADDERKDERGDDRG